MSIDVILDIFSGRPNPRWTLAGDQEAELLERIEQIQTPSLSKVPGVTGKLGYRGFILNRSSVAPEGALKVLVHEGVVDFGQDLESRVADNRDLESWLLGTASGLSIEERVRGAVTAAITGAPQNVADFFKNRAAAAKAGCDASQAADAPTYNPGAWSMMTVRPYNNCYNYADDKITNTYAQPGRASSAPFMSIECADVLHAAQSDGLVISDDFMSPLGAEQGWYVALVISPGHDYHWYRQDVGGCWSHKPGQSAVINTDNSGNAITDPRTCDRGDYTDFCTYMVTRRGLKII
jgi:hypothetical protein